MKKVFTLIALLAATASVNSVFSQTLKEKMKAKLEALDQKIIENAGGKMAVFNESDFVSLDIMAEKWVDGSYNYRKCGKEDKWYNPEKVKVEFVKGDEGKVSKIIIEGQGNAKIEKSEYSDFIKGYEGLYLKEESIFLYGLRYTGGVYIKGCVGTALNAGSVEKEIEAFHKHADSIIAIDKAKADELVRIENERLAAIRLKEYGLEGKSIAGVKIVNVKVGKSGKFGCYSTLSYDVETTLKDGRVISTDGQGYTSDYLYSYSGATVEGGAIVPAIFDKDVLTIEVTVKSDPSKKAKKEISIPYNQSISFYWSGAGHSRSSGESARNLKVEMTQVKHTETGADLLKVRIKEVDGTVLSTFKISPDANIIITLNGGVGGEDDGRVYSGGNGGTITVIKDPSVKYYSLDASVNGGRGGKNEYGSTGNSGRDGSVKVETRAVKI